MSKTATSKDDAEGFVPAGFSNSVQLNVLTFIDVAAAAASYNLGAHSYMRDNAVGSENQGTTRLVTICKQGQVINWLIYALNTEYEGVDREGNKIWPPWPKINNIVFLNEDGSEVAPHLVSTQFKVWGGPDKMRSPIALPPPPLTSVWYYWAGMVIPDLDPGIYRYRFVIELDAVRDPSLRSKYPNLWQKSISLNLDGPALNVTDLTAPAPAAKEEAEPDPPQDQLKVAGAEPSASDDLTRIEGIGPKIEGLLKAGGIHNFAGLAKAEVSVLQSILDDAGPRYRIHDPGTWPRQAGLAAVGSWDELAALQDRLKGGEEG